MTITPTKQTIKRYWHPKKIRKEKLPNRQAYIDRLRELLEDAVKVRMRTAYPVASHLSGGLDSSPIAVLVAREMKKRDPNYKLPAFAWVYPPSSDDDITKHHEWNYPTIIAEQEGMDLSFTQMDERRLKDIIQKSDLHYDRTIHLLYEDDIRKKLYLNNIRVMFSGWGGDEFISNHSYSFGSELFLKCEWNSLYRHILNYKGVKAKLKFVYKKIVVPLMPDKLYCYLPKIKCDKLNFSIYNKNLHPYVLKAYKQKTHIFSRYTACIVKQDIIRAYENGHIQSRLNNWSQESYEFHFSYAYPLLDKRLVELALQIPTKYNLDKEYHFLDRYIYRQAIKHLIPYNLLWGTHKKENIRWEKLERIVNNIFNKETNKFTKFLKNKSSNSITRSDKLAILFIDH
jgi:asparagine synthase (glutamine-hydrolysing)